MNLIGKFESLELPNSTNTQVFSAITLDDFPLVKICVNNEGYPAIIISATASSFHSGRNIKLKYIDITSNVLCKMAEDSVEKYEKCTLIVFKSVNDKLQKYFLLMCESFITKISENVSSNHIVDAFKNFIEVFKSLALPQLKSVQGLWAEIFVIEKSANPANLLSFWHDDPYDKFDFNSGNQKLEIKSTSTLERIHFFSSEQLDSLDDQQILIGSLFMKPSPKGKSIYDLIVQIEHKVVDFDLRKKLLTVTAKTLGEALEQSINFRYDYRISMESLKFYNQKDIQRIDKNSIPIGVIDVRYKSDLRNLSPVNPRDYSDGLLFSAL